jgi:hypothetical protein
MQAAASQAWDAYSNYDAVRHCQGQA